MAIKKSVTLKRPVVDAFDLFTDGIASWWPLKQGFSFGGEKGKDIFLEKRKGGRFYERFVDGEEYQVGRVTACEPPSRIVFTWNDAEWEGPTMCEVRFVADGKSSTRVEVEHRGWEVGLKATAAGKSYDGGWDLVLGCYTAAA